MVRRSNSHHKIIKIIVKELHSRPTLASYIASRGSGVVAAVVLTGLRQFAKTSTRGIDTDSNAACNYPLNDFSNLQDRP